jgi:hypothetical protein
MLCEIVAEPTPDFHTTPKEYKAPVTASVVVEPITAPVAIASVPKLIQIILLGVAIVPAQACVTGPVGVSVCVSAI